MLTFIKVIKTDCCRQPALNLTSAVTGASLVISPLLPPLPLPSALDAPREQAIEILLRRPPSAQPPLTSRPVPEAKPGGWTDLLHRARELFSQRPDAWLERNRRAIDAYQSLERFQEREYVSRLLGVDVYA